MANNALIQGAALTSKKFLDVAGAVKQGLVDSGSFSRQTPARVDENKAVQAKVNNYMRNMKTDMDFTSFTPEETATMRSFLLGQRSIYAEAAKNAAAFDDTTDPDYMLYVDQMQNVNNSFTNLAAQLKAYKKSKIEYASAMQEGLYSNGNQPSKTKEAATIYGFLDKDGDGRSDERYNAPFKILQGGNIAFDIDGQEIAYNNMEEPFLKDTKFLNSLNKTSEIAYNSGLRGNANNPYAQDAYKQQLNDTLQNEDALRSIIFDFDPEAPMLMQNPNDPTGPQIKIGTALDSGIIDLNGARDLVNERLLKAREDAYIAGSKEYKRKQAIVTPKDTSKIDNAINTANNDLSQGESVVSLYHPNHKGEKREYVIEYDDQGKAFISRKSAITSSNLSNPNWMELKEDNEWGIDVPTRPGGTDGAPPPPPVLDGFNKDVFAAIEAANPNASDAELTAMYKEKMGIK